VSRPSAVAASTDLMIDARSIDPVCIAQSDIAA
jgi:hypothetical protein